MKEILWASFVFGVVLLMSACSSYPSIDRYSDELEEYIGKSEDSVLTDFGVPDQIVKLSQGTRTLVYNQIPYKSSPHTENENLWCKTIFRIDNEARVQYFMAKGTFCVK